jgi:hypothetical protein
MSTQTLIFYLTYRLLVNSNLGFDTCYGVETKMEEIGYVCEVLARLLFIYEDNIDIEVIWILKKNQ